MTGESYGSGTGSDYTTLKYSPDSNQPVWIARYDGPANDADSAFAIAVDSNDNIYVTGRSTVSGTDIGYTTIKYSPDSNEAVWLARYKSTYSVYDSQNDIAVDSNKNIYVTGYSYDSGTKDDCITLKYSPDYTCTPLVIGDINHDCEVDIYDLRIFCLHWLESSP
ncbi:MAG: SBBP repeat-containing protein [Planctomycetota bacterium]